MPVVRGWLGLIGLGAEVWAGTGTRSIGRRSGTSLRGEGIGGKYGLTFGACSTSFGGEGNSLSGGGAGLAGGGIGRADLGVESSAGTDSVDFLLWKENCDLAAALDFIAVSDGTRRPRGRFSESKMAMFNQIVQNCKIVYIGIRWISRLSTPPFD